MIVYDLICPAHHRFEGWFPSAAGFIAQQESRTLTCPVCGDFDVQRLPSSRVNKEVGEKQEEDAPRKAPLNKEALAQAVIDYVLTHTEDVGTQFADRARRMHRGDEPAKNIRGTTSKPEAEALAEEGVTVYQLPVPPKENWH